MAISITYPAPTSGTAGAGTITTTGTNAIVTGTGTAFDSSWIGRTFITGSQWSIVKSVESTTLLTLDRTFTAVAAATYKSQVGGFTLTVSTTASEVVTFVNLVTLANWQAGTTQTQLDFTIKRLMASALSFQVFDNNLLRIACAMNMTGHDIIWNYNAHPVVVTGGNLTGGVEVGGQSIGEPIWVFPNGTGITNSPGSTSEALSIITTGIINLVGLRIEIGFNTQPGGALHIWATTGTFIIKHLRIRCCYYSSYFRVGNGTAGTGSYINVEEMRMGVMALQDSNATISFVGSAGWVGGDNSNTTSTITAPKYLVPHNAVVVGFRPFFAVAEAPYNANNSGYLGSFVEMTSSSWTACTITYKDCYVNPGQLGIWPKSNDTCIRYIQRTITVSPRTPVGAQITDFSWRLYSTRVVTTYSGTADATPSGKTVLTSGDDATSDRTYVAQVAYMYGTRAVDGAEYGRCRVIVDDSALTAQIRGYGLAEILATTSGFQGPGTCIGTGAALTVLGLTKAQAAAITGISFNGATKTVTITGNKTSTDLWCSWQYWISRVAQMDVAASWTLANTTLSLSDWACVTSGGTLTLGAVGAAASVLTLTGLLTSSLTTGGAYTFTGGSYTGTTAAPSFTAGTLNIGAVGTYGFNADSAIVRMTPTAPGTYVFNGTYANLDLRNASATHAISVQLPTGTTYNLANNTGAAITIVPPPITLTINNVVTGSDVVIFNASLPSTGDGSNVLQTFDAIAGTSVGYVYYTPGTSVTVGVFKNGYRPFYIRGITLSANSTAQAAAQSVDPNYAP